MAYTAVITKDNVNKASNGILSISLTLSVSDEVEEVFSTSLTAKYNPNSGNLNDFQSKIQDELKDRWDKYAAEAAIKNSAALDTVVGALTTAANAYINS